MNLEKLGSILGRPAAIEPLPLTLRYVPERVRAEALKGAAGAALCLTALWGLSPAPVIAVPIASVAALFLAYLVLQWRRRALRLELDGAGLTRRAGGESRRLEWSGLDSLRLHFYPHRRRSLEGTLVLALRGGTRIKLDSALDHFPTLLQHAVSAARARALALDAATEANLAQLGL